MKKILSIDDHAIIAKGIEILTQKLGEEISIGSAKNSNEALRLLKNETWDLIMLDISLKGKSGLDLLKEIKVLYPKIPALMFSLQSNVEFVRRALKLGASGYVTKDSPEEEITEAVKKVLRKGNYISKDIMEKMIFAPESTSHSELSPREFEILVKIGEGKTIKEIAAEIFLSENTVETYRARIKEKMNMKRDAELIHYCVAANFVQVQIPDTVKRN